MQCSNISGPKIEKYGFIYLFTSPASWANKDLKESSISSSVISAYKKPQGSHVY